MKKEYYYAIAVCIVLALFIGLRSIKSPDELLQIEYAYYESKGYPIRTDIKFIEFYETPEYRQTTMGYLYSRMDVDTSSKELRNLVEEKKEQLGVYPGFLCVDFEYQVIWIQFHYGYAGMSGEGLSLCVWSPAGRPTSPPW